MSSGMSPARAQLASNTAEAIAYGINLVVFIAAITIILTKREKNHVTVVLGGMTVLMFALVTAHFVAVNRYTFREFIDDRTPENWARVGDSTQVQSITTEVINCSFGDSLVIWRAWGLWGRSYKAIIVPVAMWLGALGFGSVTIWLTSNPAIDTAVYLRIMIAWAVLVLVTNIWTVGMISSVYWRYHLDVVAVVGRRKAAYHTILIFFVESGALYCLTWVVMVTLIALESQGAHIIAQLASEFTCLYPTLLIVVVCLGLTQQDRMDRESTLLTQQQHSIVFWCSQDTAMSAATSRTAMDPSIPMVSAGNASACSVVIAQEYDVE